MFSPTSDGYIVSEKRTDYGGACFYKKEEIPPGRYEIIVFRKSDKLSTDLWPVDYELYKLKLPLPENKVGIVAVLIQNKNQDPKLKYPPGF